MEINGLPVEQTETTGGNEILVAKRSRWGVSEERSGPWPGQIIECGRSLAEYDPRYLEHLSMFTDEVEIEEGDPVVLALVDPDEHVRPCAFCTHKTGVAERGVIDSDYEMRNLGGELLGYSCIACLHEAPVIEQ